MNTRKLDALVAEKVMGWTLAPHPGGVHYPQQWWAEPELDTDDWHPSTDIKAAWEVVEKFDSFDLSKAGVGDFSASGWIANKCVHVYAGTAPLAICLAALKAVGVEVPE